jgi:hypothetical protein
MKKIICVLLIMSMLAACQNAYALTPAPQRPYEVILDSGNRIFYMTPQWLTPTQDVGEARMQIKSGLYYNTEPLKSIYYVDKYFYEGSIFFSRDGMNFAVVNGFETSSASAVEFFENGSLFKSYQARDLLKDWRKASIVAGGVGWTIWQGLEFDEQQGILTVMANDERVIAFDINTGNIISDTSDTGRRLSNAHKWGIFIVPLAVIVFVLYKRGILKIRNKGLKP